MRRITIRHLKLLVLVVASAALVACQLPRAPGTPGVIPEPDLPTPEIVEPEPEPLPPPPPPEPPSPLLRWYPREIHLGDYLVLQLEHVTADDTIRSTLDPPAEFFPHDGGQRALAPLSYWATGDSLVFSVMVEREGETLLDREVRIVIADKEFDTQRLYVTAEQSAMRTDDLWAKDWAHISQARVGSHPEPLWEGEFLMPVEGRISTEFGQIRYINDVPSGRHSGLDIAAPTGTPILSGNSGIVTLSMELNVTGNTVIIDHGLNLFGTYYHLDQLGVEPGDWVDKGDVIGTVGSTGFSTGPHLHWTMGIGHTPISPWLLVDEDPLALFGSLDPPVEAPEGPLR